MENGAQLSSSGPERNIANLRATLNDALRQAGRPEDAVTIVAVSKKQPIDRVRAALDAGHRVFGENRVQEAQKRWSTLKEDYEGVDLHLVGPLQSNKAQDAVALFDVIETVDRPKIAKAIASEIARQGKTPRLLVQVNTGEEPQKAGVSPSEAAAFLSFCRDELSLPIQGLMCIPPAGDDPAPHFALLDKLARSAGLETLSMGMSADFTIAAQLGATHVRIGTGVFGPREA